LNDLDGLIVRNFGVRQNRQTLCAVARSTCKPRPEQGRNNQDRVVSIVFDSLDGLTQRTKESLSEAGFEHDVCGIALVLLDDVVQ
jgi:hypothetical protein